MDEAFLISENDESVGKQPTKIMRETVYTGTLQRNVNLVWVNTGLLYA